MKKRIASLLVVLHIMMTNLVACNSNNNVELNTNDETHSIVVTKEKVEETINDEIDYTEYLSLLEKEINNLELIYKNNEYYPNIDTINKYSEIANNIGKCNATDTDYTQLYNIIASNTLDRFGFDNGFFHSPDVINHYLSSEDAKNYYDTINTFTKAFYKAITNIFYYATNDTNEDMCALKEISIINKSLEEKNGGLGLYEPEENLVTIDYKKVIKNLKEINEYKIENNKEEISLTDYLATIIEHELNHVRQIPCKHRSKNLDYPYDIGFDKEYISFIIESSAESSIYNFNPKSFETIENYNYAYLNYRESETLLLLLATFKDNKNIEQYYEAVFDTDIEKFWEFFELDTDEKKVQFYKILYAFNAIYLRNELGKYIIDDNDCIEVNEAKKFVGDTYLIEMMKIITTDLIGATDRDNLTFNESVLLYNLVKSYLVNEASYLDNTENNDHEEKYSDTFISKISKIDEIFIDYLTNKYSISYDDVKNEVLNKNYFFELCSFTDYLDDNTDLSVTIENYDSFKNLSTKYPMLSNIVCTNFCTYTSDKFNEYIKKY